MKNSTAKKPLLMSIATLILCVVMLMGTTFAWFTDTASVSVNQIQSGTLDVSLVNSEGKSIEGTTLAFIDKDDNNYWEPGCTYSLPDVFVKNEGNLALKYKIVITGIKGDAKLNEAIEWTITTPDGETYSADTEHHLAAKQTSSALTIKGHMKEDAGNDYQDLTIDGIAITVYATQDTVESDSNGNTYDANAEYPEMFVEPTVNATGKVDVTTENNVTTADATFNAGGVNVTVPAGVTVEDGKTELGVSVSSKTESESNLTVTENEKLSAFDVHVEGVADNNDKAIIVELGAVLPKNLNSSAIKLSHVENGVAVPMTYVPNDQQLTAHNQFKYDPATGHVTVALVSFSEITVIFNSTNPWDGSADKTWYNETDTEFTVRNAQQLAGLAQLVTAGNDFKGKTVKVAADIDLASEAIFYPIGVWSTENNVPLGVDLANTGAFSGTFDGMGHTIKGLKQDGWEMNGNYSAGYYKGTLGLFGRLVDATVKNLNIDNFECVMEFTYMGAVAGIANGTCVFENIAITNTEMWGYNTPTGGVVGCDDASDEGNELTFKNITVDATNTIHSLWGTWDGVSGGILGYLAENSSADFDRCNVACVMDVYNDFCGNYQWGIYRYCGMFIGAVKKTTTDGDRQICDLTNVTATNCTVNFGEWSKQYYYCEFEKNSMASYSEYYQFSRIPYEDVVFENGVAVGCKNHTHTENEKAKAWQFIFDAVFGSWGNWGVSPVDLEKYNNIKIEDVTQKIEETEKDNAEVKFEVTDITSVNTGKEYVVSDFFTAIVDDINGKNVYISFTDINKTGVSGTYTANAENWANGTLTFTGTGTLKLTIQDYDFCKPTELYVTVAEQEAVEKFDLVFENTDKYLYRVGNGNDIKLSSLFAEKADNINDYGVYVSYTKLDENTDVAMTFTPNTTDWTKGTLQFTGTGPVKITIQDYDFCEPTELLLEVVDGKNATTAANVSNCNIILLNDIKTAGLSIQNGYTLFGNGFKIEDTRTAEQTTSNNGWIQIFGSYIDNAQIIGQDYPTAVTSGVSNQYYSPSVRINNGGGIYNSLVNGGRYAILSSGGNIEIVNTTITGGAAANLNVSGTGTLLLDNLTTVQVSGTTNPPYGMAIAVESQDVQITIKNDLKQYNWAKSSDIPSSYSNIFSDLYTSSNYSNIRYTDGSDTYVNTGIFFFSDSASLDGSNLVNANGGESFTIKEKTYTKVTKTVFGNTGVCYTLNGASASADMLTAPDYASAGQYHIAPEFNYNITDDNSDERHYAYYDTDTGILKVGYEAESTTGYVWTPTPTAYKNSITLNVAVTMNGVDYTGKSITFNQTGNYSIIYTYTDANNYDKDGNKYSVIYEKILPVTVLSLAQDAAHAEFNFFAPDGTTYSATVVEIDGKKYVMPNVSATEKGKVMSTTINGTTVYAPYVECQYNDNRSDFNYVYPLLTGVNITDYEGGVPDGATTTYSNSTTDTALFGTPGTKFNVITALETWNYSISSDKMDFKTKSGYGLCLWSGAKGSNLTAMSIIGEFSYTDNAGTTYYYCVYYNMAAHTCPSCITPETLITLADGTQMMAKDLTGNEMLLAFNHESGKFEATPVAYVLNHDGVEAEHIVTTLTFANGYEVDIIGEHVFFDNTIGRYVTLTAENANDFIGHNFAMLEGTSALVSVDSEIRRTQAYEVVTYKALNCVTNGVLSCSGYIENLLNMFEFDADMKYVDMQEDINTYGLYTYADFEDLIPEVVFEMYNAKYLKIAVGKGQITWEDIEALIDFYYSLNITPLQ